MLGVAVLPLYELVSIVGCGGDDGSGIGASGLSKITNKKYFVRKKTAGIGGSLLIKYSKSQAIVDVKLFILPQSQVSLADCHRGMVEQFHVIDECEFCIAAVNVAIASSIVRKKDISTRHLIHFIFLLILSKSIKNTIFVK